MCMRPVFMSFGNCLLVLVCVGFIRTKRHTLLHRNWEEERVFLFVLALSDFNVQAFTYRSGGMSICIVFHRISKCICCHLLLKAKALALQL